MFKQAANLIGSKVRLWRNTYKADKKTVQVAGYTGRCKWMTEGYVYVLCKRFASGITTFSFSNHTPYSCIDSISFKNVYN